MLHLQSPCNGIDTWRAEDGSPPCGVALTKPVQWHRYCDRYGDTVGQTGCTYKARAMASILKRSKQLKTKKNFNVLREPLKLLNVRGVLQGDVRSSGILNSLQLASNFCFPGFSR